MSTTFGIWLGLTLWLGPTVFGLSLFAWKKIFKNERRVISAGMLTLLGILILTGARIELAIICLTNTAVLWWTYGKEERMKMDQSKDQFKNQNYLNIETYRRNGQGVRTPVWFVDDGEAFYIRTGANSGKVKRIRNNPDVQIAPCKADGTVIGEWISAKGKDITDTEKDKQVDKLLGKKYGIQKNLFSWMSRLRGDQYTILKIEIPSAKSSRER